MDLKEKSYIFGLFGTDGYIDNKRIGIELNKKDGDIIYKLYNLISNSKINTRVRNTNFKDNYESIIFTNHRKEFREELLDFGFPTENKTDNISIPSKEFIEKDFWRGVIDGDGSIGFTKDNEPFVSLVTKSEALKKEYCEYLERKFGIIKHINRNKRDNVYNITIKNEDAINFIKEIYIDSTLYIDRKYNSAISMLEWKRTKSKKSRRNWTEEEIDFIKNNNIEDSMKKLNRTYKSIRAKLYRL